MKLKMRLITRMLVFFLLPAMAGLTIMSCVDFYLSRQAITSQIEEELTLVTDGQVEALTNVVSMLKSVTTNLADAKRITDTLSAIDRLGGFNPKDVPASLVPLQKLAQQTLDTVANHFPRVSGAGLVDVHGRVIAHTQQAFIGSSVADRAYFKQALQGKTGFENVQSRASKSLATIVSRPVLENKKVVGVVYISVDLPKLAQSTVYHVKIAQTGQAFVYDSEGVLLMHPNADYIGDKDGDLPWVQQILASPQGLLNYVWKGMAKMAAFKRVPETDWTVVVGVERDDVTAPITRIFRLSAMLGISISAIVGLIIFVVARNISNTLRASAAIVTTVAEGNFTLSDADAAKLEADSQRGDAIAHLALGIRGMISNLERLFKESTQKTASAEEASRIAAAATHQAEKAQNAAENAKRDGMLAAAHQLEEVVAHISTTADTLMHLITASGQGTERQSLRISETAVAMEEMNSTVVEVSRSASETSSLTTSTRAKAQQGALLVENSIKNIHQIQEDSLLLKDDMTALGQSAQNISQIMSVISDIADQTNLLALNAAIEAARAGDAGRGFAVVADEVRKLAEKTMHSTSDVGNAIRAIQESSSKSITQVEAAVVNIERTTEQSLTSGTALGEIVNMMEVTADQVRAIAAASEQQSATSEEINQSISQIDTIAQETALAMRQATTAVNDMVQQTAALNRLIEELKHG